MINPEKIPDYKHCFFTKDGKVIRNVAELRDELKVMPLDVFSHHVSGQKNDFSNWLRDVFGEERLADKISKAATRDDMTDILEKNSALAILMTMPKAGKEEVKKAKRYISSAKKPKKYVAKGPSIESKIKGGDVKKPLRYKKEGKYVPSPIEKTAILEAEKLKTIFEKEKEPGQKEKGIEQNKKEVGLKYSMVQKCLSDYLSIKKKNFIRGIAISVISIIIIVLLYFAIAKAF